LKNLIIGDFLKNDEIIKLIDFTLLKREKTNEELMKFLFKAKEYQPQAVCIFPEDILYAKEILDSSISIAVVVGGFPEGSSNCEEIVEEIRMAIKLGADEIDIVLEPREDDNYPNEIELEKLVTMREASEGKILKVIIETPLLTERKIRAITRMSLAVGVDFVKTCTGKRGGCKERDVDILSYELMRHELTFKECLGMKISGGISEKHKLMRFIELIRKNDSKIIDEKRLRVGSSSLIENLVTIE
tara:strand:- start:4097 stop:4831 length:735 start_codon:yes stop_codon:yes gene_type:complete